MAGVGLVGFSGSLIKDAIKDAPLPSLSVLNAIDRPQTLTEEPEVTKVLVGKFSGRYPLFVSSCLTRQFQGVFFILFAQILSVMFTHT